MNNENRKLLAPGFRLQASLRRAFTLIEVLASLAILALVFPVVMYGLSLASNAASLARHRTQATILAQTKLDELLATQDFSTLSGDFGDDYPGYTWTIELNDWDTLDGFSSVFSSSISSSTSSNTQQLQQPQQLDVTVSWTQHNRTYQAALSTLLYQQNSSSSSLGGLLP
ncbi:MAG: type II secretion system GspH family protein [Phycisphaerales bacterium]|nr:type II secretion system GspH family protein [Phycisphaerales bacterium]